MGLGGVDYFPGLWDLGLDISPGHTFPAPEAWALEPGSTLTRTRRAIPGTTFTVSEPHPSHFVNEEDSIHIFRLLCRLNRLKFVNVPTAALDLEEFPTS